MMEEFIARVFRARDIAHIRHLVTKSYAEHIALKEFYESIIPIADSIIEAYSANNEVGYVSYSVNSIDNIAEYLMNEAIWLESVKQSIAGNNTSIVGNIDDLIIIYLSTVYKLNNLS